MEKDPILVFDRPDFVVRLHEDWIDVDLKKGGKAKLERAIEKDPLLKKSIGFVLQSTIPSDVELCEIDRVEVDDKGKLKLVIPRHVDIVLPLGVDDANKLARAKRSGYSWFWTGPEYFGDLYHEDCYLKSIGNQQSNQNQGVKS